MADSFFDFDTDMPASEAGHDDDDPIGHGKEEMDMVNDQTFGDSAQCGDWETQHEAMAGKLRGLAPSHHHEHHDDPMMMSGGHMTYRNGADSRGESPENELEQSINQLVVEDEEENKPEVSIRGRPIPGRQLPVDLDNLFGPASPPSLNVISEGHQNIWGSPNAQENYSVQKQEEGLKMLLMQMQAAGMPQIPLSFPPVLPGGGKVLSHSLPEAYTLEQVEGGAAPKAFTVEELERQLTGGSTDGRRVQSPGLPLPIGTPPSRNYIKQAPGYIPQMGQIQNMHGPQGYHHQQQQLLQILANNLPSHHPHPRTPLQAHPHTPASDPPPALASRLANQTSIPNDLPAAKTVTPQQSTLAQRLSQQDQQQQQAKHVKPTLVAANAAGQLPPTLASRLSNESAWIHDHEQQQQSRSRLSSTPSQQQQPQTPLATTPMQPYPSPGQVPSHTELRMVQALIGGEQLPTSVKLSAVAKNLLKSILEKRGEAHRLLGEQDYNDVIDALHAARGRDSGVELGKSPSARTMSMSTSVANTPPQQRMPVHSAYTDPSHIRGGQRGSLGGGWGQRPGGTHPRQNLFNERPRHDSGSGYPDNRDGQARNYHNNRDGYNNNRGDGGYSNGYNNSRGNRGNYYQNGGDRRGDYHQGDGYQGWDRGYHRDRGYHDNRYNDDWEYRRSPYNKNRHPGPHGDYYDDDEGEDLTNQDEYAGLMSKREKDWIVKIQLMQLQTDNPYLDDYYYTLWSLKKLAKERAEQERLIAEGVEPSLVLPQMSGRVEFKPYKPDRKSVEVLGPSVNKCPTAQDVWEVECIAPYTKVQFENSLGKLTAASVHNPRQIIDVRRDNSTHKEDATGRELRRFRQLLLDIEQAFDLLLVIDDLEKRALALPEDARPSVLENRRAAIHSMFLGMRADDEETDFFRRVINVRKGIKLIARLLTMLEKHESVIMTTALFLYLGDVINKKGWVVTVLPPVYTTLSHMIVMADLETLVGYVMAFVMSDTRGASLNLQQALKNQFATSVIWSLLKRGENIYLKESPLDLDVKDQNSWVSFVEQVADTLSVMTYTELPCDAIPQASLAPVRDHFKRLLDRALYLAIEDMLQQLSTDCEAKTAASKKDQSTAAVSSPASKKS